MEDVLPAAPPCESDILLYLFGNNIFCPRTYRQSNAAASEVSAGFALERPCTTSNNGGWFQFDIVLFEMWLSFLFTTVSPPTTDIHKAYACLVLMFVSLVSKLFGSRERKDVMSSK